MIKVYLGNDSSHVVHYILDALGDVINILCGHATNRDSTVLGHVNAVLLHHGLALRYRQASEGEHANLGSNVRPVTLDSLSLDGTAESGPHVVHASADNDELVEPLLAQSGVIENLGGNSSTVLGRRRVVSADNNLDLGEDASCLIFISADEVEAASALTVKAHDLGERLSNDHLEALVDEEAKAIGILVKVSGSEALIGSVEEGIELLALANVCDLLPLGVGRINTSGVVRASVEKNA